MEIHLHIHGGEVKEGKAPKRRSSGSKPIKTVTPKVKSVKRSRAMKQAQKKARLKSGKFRKGWDKSRLMKEYHRIMKRMK